MTGIEAIQWSNYWPGDAIEAGGSTADLDAGTTLVTISIGAIVAGSILETSFPELSDTLKSTGFVGVAATLALVLAMGIEHRP